MQYMYQVRNTIAIDEEYHYKSNNFKCHKYAKWNEKIMQYMYQVRNTITIDEEYYYKSNNLKYHKSLISFLCKGKTP